MSIELLNKIKDTVNYHNDLEKILDNKNIERIEFLKNYAVENHYSHNLNEHVKYILHRYEIDNTKVFLESMNELFLKKEDILNYDSMLVRDIINNNTKVIIEKSEFRNDNKILQALVDINSCAAINDSKVSICRYVYDEYLLDDKLNEFIVYDAEYDDMRYYLYGLLHYVNFKEKMYYKYFQNVKIFTYEMDIKKIENFSKILKKVSEINNDYFFGYTNENKTVEFNVSNSGNEYSLSIILKDDIKLLYEIIENELILKLLKNIKQDKIHLRIEHINNVYVIQINEKFINISDEMLRNFFYGIIESKKNYGIIFKIKAFFYKLQSSYVDYYKNEYYKNKEIIIYKLLN